METKKIKRNGILGKGLMVLLITCALEIPILLLGGLIDDRRELSSDAKEELATSWGGTLEVDVPQLCVPFFMNSTDKDGKAVKELKLRKAIMVAQSYMPVQDIHIVTNLNDKRISPWYIISQNTKSISFPEFNFKINQIMRFKK